MEPPVTGTLGVPARIGAGRVPQLAAAPEQGDALLRARRHEVTIRRFDRYPHRTAAHQTMTDR